MLELFIWKTSISMIKNKNFHEPFKNISPTFSYDSFSLVRREKSRREKMRGKTYLYYLPLKTPLVEMLELFGANYS
jgi:hypothetical protein